MVDIIGKIEEDAEKCLNKQGKKLRVTKRDGEPYLVTMDYCPERINVVVESGKIIRVVGAG